MTIDPARQVFILSNQAAADAAAQMLGVQAFPAPGLDWASLQGCRLVVWPTNTGVARAAAQAGAQSVKLVHPGDLAAQGWDAAEAQQEGWSREDLVDWLRAHAEEYAAPAPAQEAEPVPAGEEVRPSPTPRAEPARSAYTPAIQWPGDG